MFGNNKINKTKQIWLFFLSDGQLNNRRKLRERKLMQKEKQGSNFEGSHYNPIQEYLEIVHKEQNEELFFIFKRDG